MSIVKNEPKIKNSLIVGIREQLEHRALWMYLLTDEAAKKGFPVRNMCWMLFADAVYTKANC